SHQYATHVVIDPNIHVTITGDVTLNAGFELHGGGSLVLNGTAHGADGIQTFLDVLDRSTLVLNGEIHLGYTSAIAIQPDTLLTGTGAVYGPLNVYGEIN